MAREIELKLEYVGDNWREVHTELTSIERIGPYRLGPTRTELITDAYRDTEDLRLQSIRAALRVRTRGSVRQVCLKYGDDPTAGVFSRIEVEVSDTPAGWRQIADRLSQLGTGLSLRSDGSPLQPLIEIRSIRFRRPIQLDTLPVAELTLDQITYPNIDTTYNDRELELAAGASRHHLDLLLDRLNGMHPGQWQPATCSKFARGLALLGITNGTQ